MWVQGCYKKGIPIDSNIIQEKVKSLYDNLQQKKGEGCEAREFSASKGWFDHFIQRFGLKKCQDNRRRSICQQRQQKSSQMAVKKIFEEKGYLL